MGGSNYIRGKNGILFTPPGVDTINNFLGSENSTSTSEIILSSVLIPSNSIKTNDILEVESRLRKNNSNGLVNIRIRIGTGQTTSDTLVGNYSSTTVGNTFIPIRRVIKVADNTNSSEVIDTASSISFDDTYSGFTISNLTIDWTKNNYISICGKLVSASDNMNCMYIKTKKYTTS